MILADESLVYDNTIQFDINWYKKMTFIFNFFNIDNKDVVIEPDTRFARSLLRSGSMALISV